MTTTENSTKSISVIISPDCGCEITEAEFEAYLQLCANAVSESYPGYEVEVEPGSVVSTRVRFSDDGTADESDMTNVRGITQDVWESGDFWVMTEDQAIAKGEEDGIEDVETVLAEQGRDAVLATLKPGHIAWDENAINVGAAQLSGISEEHHEAYYAAYAHAARKRAKEIEAESTCLVIRSTDKGFAARCGMFRVESECDTALLSAIWDAIELDQGEPDLDNDGYAKYTATLTLGGVELCSAECWRYCGWISRGAHADLDGSGLANWGNSQPGGWRVCSCDSQENGLTPLIDAYAHVLSQATREVDGFGAIEDEQEARRVAKRTIDGGVNEPGVPEPDAEWVASNLGRETVLVDVRERGEVKIGVCLGHVVVVGPNEFIVDPDEDDVEKLATELVTDAAKRDGYWAAEIADLTERLADG